MTSLKVSLLALASVSLANPCSPPTTGNNCMDFSIPVTVDADSIIWDIPKVNNDVDAVDFVWNLTENGTKKNILQLATHGGNVGSTYWNPSYQPEKYSHVEAALKKGYSIFWYDRIGTGSSDKPDAYDIAGFPVQVEVIQRLTILARNGNLVPSQHNLSSIPKFDKIVQVGHSIGSLMIAHQLAKYPDSAADAAILTGFVPNKNLGRVGQAEFGLVYAATAGKRFNDRPGGYFVSANPSNVHMNFFKKPYFDPAMLLYADANIKDTSTAAEAAGLSYAVETLPASEYSKPLLMVAGEHDYPVCSGDCNGAWDLKNITTKYFPKATDVQVHIQAGVGHALPLHHSAPEDFEDIFKYLSDHGL